jgi:hypothetical protein
MIAWWSGISRRVIVLERPIDEAIREVESRLPVAIELLPSLRYVTLRTSSRFEIPKVLQTSTLVLARLN